MTDEKPVWDFRQATAPSGLPLAEVTGSSKATSRYDTYIGVSGKRLDFRLADQRKNLGLNKENNEYM